VLLQAQHKESRLQGLVRYYKIVVRCLKASLLPTCRASGRVKARRTWRTSFSQIWQR